MNIILANSMNEIQKLLAKRVTKLFLAASVLFPILTKILVNKLFLTNWMTLPAENINYLLLDLFNTFLLPLFIFIAATDLFTSEGERGTLFQVRPILRIEIFFSKAASIGIFTLLHLMILWCFTVISSILFDKSFDFSVLLVSFKAYAISWFPLMVLCAFAVMVALLVNSSVLAISSMIVLYLIMQFMPYVLPGSYYILPASYLDWYMYWIEDVSIQWILQTVTYLCSAFALFLTTGYYMFNRKEA
jgi:ABC-2 type transport system permease protein